MVHLQFLTTNNEVEYEAVLSSLDLTKASGAKSAVIHCDSQVVVRHINSDYEAKGEWMKEYLSMVKSKMGEEFLVEFIKIPREVNELADHLAKVASTMYTDVLDQVLSFIQHFPTIDKVEVQVIPLGVDWTTPIISYLRDGTWPDDCNASVG